MNIHSFEWDANLKQKRKLQRLLKIILLLF
jgi:hypothetical protein